MIFFLYFLCFLKLSEKSPSRLKPSSVVCNVRVAENSHPLSNNFLGDLITARKRSLQRLCFHRCLSVHGEGVSVSVWGGLCPGVSVQGGGSVQGGLPRGSLSRGSLSGRPPKTEIPPYSNERVVHILLECILV